MQFAAVGDIVPIRRLPGHYAGQDQIIDWLSHAQARYFNLETTLHREGECYGFSLNGGSYLRSEPEVLDDCKKFGFNMTTFCNNHTMDYAYDGLVKTLEHVRRSGLVHAGTGINLDQAAAPAYLDTPEGRVAIIGMTATCNSTFNDVCIAGQQSRRTPGRPGVNQLRFQETLYVTAQQMEQIKAIAEATNVNAQEDIGRREGYRSALPEGQFNFGKHVRFRTADRTYKEVTCNPEDLARLETSLCDAKLQADYILVSIHSHEVGGSSKETPPQFLEEFAHFCIDHGVDAVIGHGPHLLRPIEIYQGRPIFYSLGNFLFQNENIPYQPEEAYAAQGLTSDSSMYELFRRRSRDFTRGLQTQKVMFESVIPRWEIRDGKLVSLALLPIELGFGLPRSRSGLPVPAQNDDILHRLAAMSAPYGTRMDIRDGVAHICLDAR